MIYSVCYLASPHITHSVSAVDGRPHPYPAVLTYTQQFSFTPGAVPLIFIDICPAVMPITCGLGPPRHPYFHPSVF